MAACQCLSRPHRSRHKSALATRFVETLQGPPGGLRPSGSGCSQRWRSCSWILGSTDAARLKGFPLEAQGGNLRLNGPALGVNRFPRGPAAVTCQPASTGRWPSARPRSVQPGLNAGKPPADDCWEVTTVHHEGDSVSSSVGPIHGPTSGLDDPAFQRRNPAGTVLVIPNGNMLHKTRYALQNFVARPERFGYVVDWPHDSMFERRFVSSATTPISGEQPRRCTTGPPSGMEGSLELPRSHGHKLQRESNASELETATGLLDENWDEDDFQLDKLIDASASHPPGLQSAR